ncbi:sulfate transporter [Hydrogenophaga crassostreae]|uniref:Sodium-independent anion transporter n=1 Tax=Hydrogenophaga crassostreae TaxID=1763535 RepID=A0A167IZN1_9BURK|nr:SulP family inorganic anion transporter [Hydrogenophaga crassostreae]AOW11925.1 sodium-independent anion transporter [Hydrogenophaga crassostreae]OAD43872.1 sulfate transporter [Hydrogenophaga crassostreae]
MHSSNGWQRHLPFLQWPRLTPSLLRGELLAGVTVGLMLVPQGIAYALLAGMPLVAGLYASLLPALIAVLFSASPRLSVGPTALSCLLVSASLSGLAEPGTARWIELAAWLALMSGLLQVGVGLLRSGWLLSLVNAPVLMAFTQGAGLLIIGSQVLTLFGLPNDWAAALNEPSLHLPSLAFGVGSYLALALFRRWSRTFPSVLVLVVLAAMVSVWTGFEASGGRVIGDLPTGLPPLALPSWPGTATLTSLLMPTLMITLVSFLETASSARIDSRDQGQRWNREQDLIGHGLAKMAAGLSGAFPTSTSFSRSVLNRYAGARTGWSVVFSVAVVALALLFTPMLHSVPMPVLAAVVVAAVQSLLAPSEFVKLWRVSRVEAGIAVVTFGITLLAAPRLYWGVLAGVVMSLSHFLYLRLNPRIIEVGLHPDGSLRDRNLWNLPPLAPFTYALRMDAELDFASANDFERIVTQYLVAHPDTRHVMLIAHPINQIDATGVETFGTLLGQLAVQNITLHLVGLKLPVERSLKAAGLLAPTSMLKTYRTETEALVETDRMKAALKEQDPSDQ